MRLRLYFDQFGQIPIPCPPLSEQASIAAYCSCATANLDKSIETAYREFSLLREYRARLIADVVTGQLDVRGIDLPATPSESPELEDWNEIDIVDAEGMMDTEEVADAAD